MFARTEKQNKHIVDVVFVGGGPATLGCLTNACKNNKLNELVGKGDGIAILESEMALGSGGLMGFGINSNTSANGFIKCLYKRKEITQGARPNPNGSPNQNKAKAPVPAAETMSPEGSPVRKKLKEKNCGLEEDDSDDNDMVDESEVYQPTKYEYLALNPFVDLYKQSPLIQMSFEFGPSIIPLSAVGMILNYTGNHLLQFIHKVYGRRVFFPHHKAISVQLMSNGECVTTAMRTECSIILDPPSENDNGQLKDTPGYRIVKHGETQVTFRSKAVVLSNGGTQSVNPNFYNWFPCMGARKEDVILSDYFLKRTGYLETMRRIRVEGKRRIVIIGGSHSGFSSAIMLLNGPSSLLKNTSVIPTVQHVYKREGKFTFPGALLKTIENCNRCCTCSYLKKEKIINKTDKCSCVCRCFGFFKYSDWGFDYSNDLPHFEDGSIKILYRDKIKVFYNRVSAAAADGYTEFKPTTFSNKNGYLYSFTGLRGDAKRLYKSIVKNEEKRVRLILAPTPEDQLKHIEDADLVIWACGYQTNPVVVRDTENKVVQMQAKVPFTQYDVDQKCRIITSDNMILTKTFGSGLAFPLRTNDGMILSEAGKVNPRADSFSLYSNFVANTMLGNLLPKSRLDNKLHKTNRPNRKGLNPPANKTNTNATQSNNSRANNNNTTAQGSASTSVSRSNNQSQTAVKLQSVTAKPVAVINKQPMSPKNNSNSHPATKLGVSHLNPPKELRNNSASSPRPTSVGIIKPEVTNYMVPIGEINLSGPTPGYMASNYSSQARAVSNQPETSKKKHAWIPSSQYQAAPINRIPKDTHKAIEQRIMQQNERDKSRVAAAPTTLTGLVNYINGQPSEYQAILAESSSAGATMSVVDAIQLYSGNDQALQNAANTAIQKTLPAFPLKTTNLQNQIGEGLDAVSNLPTTTYALSSSFKLSNQNMNGSPQTTTFYNQSSSLGESSTLSSPQKNIIASPLIYNQKATLIDNTPQVHKRKASFKLVTSSGKELNNSQSIAISNAGSNIGFLQNNKIDYVSSQMMVSTNGIQTKLITKISESHANSKINNFAHNQTAHSPVKPASQSQVKRHTNQNSSTKKKASKKVLTSAQKQATHNTNFVSDGGSGEKSMNQKSSPNIKAKRIGAFAKNHNGKQFQQQDQTSLKTDKQAFSDSNVVPAQQNQQLSNLASAGQRQIFNDDGISVNSAKRMEQINKIIAPGLDIANTTTIPNSIQTIEQFELGGSQTPKQNSMVTQQQSQLTTSNSRRRSTLNSIKNHARNLPMSDNFVTSYVEKSQNSLAENTKHQNNASQSKLLPSRRVQQQAALRNQSSPDPSNRDGSRQGSYMAQVAQHDAKMRQERVIMSSHKERQKQETPLQGEMMEQAQMTLTNHNYANHIFRTPQKKQTLKNAYSMQNQTSTYEHVPMSQQIQSGMYPADASPNLNSSQKAKSIPRTQRSASKSTYQPGIVIQNPVITNQNEHYESPSPQKTLYHYQKQIQQNINQLTQQQLNYLDMTANSEGRANSTSVVPVKIFQLPIQTKTDHQVTVVTVPVSENTGINNLISSNNHSSSGHRKNIPSQMNQQQNSQVANYGLMYVNPQGQARPANSNMMVTNPIVKQTKTASLAVAQQYHNSPIKTTPAKVQSGQVNTNAGLSMYIVKPTIVQNTHSLSQSPPITKLKSNIVDHTQIYRVPNCNQIVAQTINKQYKPLNYVNQQQVAKQQQSSALV